MAVTARLLVSRVYLRPLDKKTGAPPLGVAKSACLGVVELDTMPVGETTAGPKMLHPWLGVVKSNSEGIAYT